MRLPMNVRTGLWRWPRKDGRFVPLDRSVVVGAWRNRRMAPV